MLVKKHFEAIWTSDLFQLLVMKSTIVFVKAGENETFQCALTVQLTL